MLTYVGLMLGAWAAMCRRGLWYDRAHFHRHRHIQAHSQAGETTVHAVAPHTHGFRWRTLLVGLMHGVAGTAAMLVLAAS